MQQIQQLQQQHLQQGQGTSQEQDQEQDTGSAQCISSITSPSPSQQKSHPKEPEPHALGKESPNPSTPTLPSIPPWPFPFPYTPAQPEGQEDRQEQEQEHGRYQSQEQADDSEGKSAPAPAPAPSLDTNRGTFRVLQGPAQPAQQEQQGKEQGKGQQQSRPALKAGEPAITASSAAAPTTAPTPAAPNLTSQTLPCPPSPAWSAPAAGAGAGLGTATHSLESSFESLGNHDTDSGNQSHSQPSSFQRSSSQQPAQFAPEHSFPPASLSPAFQQLSSTPAVPKSKHTANSQLPTSPQPQQHQPWRPTLRTTPRTTTTNSTTHHNALDADLNDHFLDLAVATTCDLESGYEDWEIDIKSSSSEDEYDNEHKSPGVPADTTSQQVDKFAMDFEAYYATVYPHRSLEAFYSAIKDENLEDRMWAICLMSLTLDDEAWGQFESSKFDTYSADLQAALTRHRYLAAESAKAFSTAGLGANQFQLQAMD